MAITWPAAAVPRQCVPKLANFAASGPRSGAGKRQLVYSDAGLWKVDYREIVLTNHEAATSYLAALARLRTGESVNLPIFTAYPPLGADTPGRSVELDGAHALRATTVNVTTVHVTMAPGVYFSLGTALHQVTEVTSGPGGGGSGNYAVKVLPPLRYTYTSGQAVRVNTPLLRCVLEDLSVGDPEFDRAGHAFPSLSFVEE